MQKPAELAAGRLAKLHRLTISRIDPRRGKGTGDDGHECGMYVLPLYQRCKILKCRYLNHHRSTKVVPISRLIQGWKTSMDGYRKLLLWLPNGQRIRREFRPSIPLGITGL